MKPFHTQLLRSARSSRLPRRLLFANSRSAWTPAAPQLSKAERKSIEELNMAPKGPKFELKTPKGTKDCRNAPHVLAVLLYTLSFLSTSTTCDMILMFS
jgi:hypothetical protein